MFLNAYVRIVCPNRHLRTFVWLTQGGDQSILQVLEGKLARIIQGIPTMRIEHITIIMQEFVEGL